MSYLYYDATNAWVAAVKKFSAWRNADAAFSAGVLYAIDEFIQGAFVPALPYAQPIGKADSYLPKYMTMNFGPGTWIETSYFETGRNLYHAMGSCATTSSYKHAIALRNSQTPVNIGRLIHRGHDTTAEREVMHVMGTLPTNLHIECTEEGYNAIQTLGLQHAYSISTYTTLTEPTSTGKQAFNWTNKSVSVFDYNSNAIEVDVVGWGLDIMNRTRMGAVDSNGYYTRGKMMGFRDIRLTLNVIPYGKNIFETMRTKFESYAGDLDFSIRFTRSSGSYVNFSHTKLYLEPWEIVPSSSSTWFEGYMVTLHQTNAGSFAVEEVNDLSIGKYEVS